MDVREKLVELLVTADDYENSVCRGYPCKVCQYKGTDCTYKAKADHLIANGVTVQEWISVKDRLPEDASTVLASDSYGTICSAYYVGRWHGGGDLDEDAVTYWMPLPTAPKEDK